MKKDKGARRKKGKGGEVFLAVVTMVNLGLTLALALVRRRDVIRAVEDEEGRIKVLVEESRKQK